jgi:DNA-binding YbaB/EbfC family protein
MLAKAQEVQQRIAQIQQELARRTVEGSSGGGMVTAVVTGELRVLDIKIEPSVMDDREMLQDLVAAAINAAMDRAREMVQQEMQKAAGGVAIPGLGSA